MRCNNYMMCCTMLQQDDMPNARQYVKQDVVTRLTAAYTNTDSESAAAAAAEQRELQELEQLHGHTGSSSQSKRRARRHTHNNSSSSGRHRGAAAGTTSGYYSDGDYDSATDDAAYSEAQQVERQLAQLATSQGLPDRNEDPELSRSGDASFLDFLQRQQAFVQQRSEKIRCVAAADVPSFQPKICASSRRMQASHKRGSFLHRVAQNALKKDKEALRLKVCFTHTYVHVCTVTDSSTRL
jgi:hypothetical protein